MSATKRLADMARSYIRQHIAMFIAHRNYALRKESDTSNCPQ